MEKGNCIQVILRSTSIFRIKAKSRIEFSDMLFFDDEARNKRDLDGIGVLMILIEDGVTRNVIKKGLEEFARLRQDQVQTS